MRQKYYNMRHRIFIFLMLLITALTASARDFEYEGIIYTVLDEEAKTVETKQGEVDGYIAKVYTGNSASGNLTLPSHPKDGEVEYTLTRIGNYGFWAQSLVSVDIPNTVLTIGDHAFFCCTSLKSVKFPNSLKIIEGAAFYN